MPTEFETGRIYSNGRHRRFVVESTGGVVRWMSPVLMDAVTETPLAEFEAWFDEGGPEGPVPRLGTIL